MYRDLEKGVYLFVQTQKTQISNQVYQSEPFIITVPGNYGGKFIFLADAITDPADFMVAPLIGNILVMINKRIMQEIIKRFYEHEARTSLM